MSWSKWNWLDAVAEWNWRGYENKPLQVSVYSSCEKAQLFLNNRSLGIKPTNRATKYMATWDVPYQQGELKVVGYSGNKILKTASLHTADAPANIVMKADRSELKAGKQDLAYITVELVDANGYINPVADNLLKFDIEGDAEIVGVGNANPVSLESFQLPQRKAWKGKCLVIVKAGARPGNIILKATGSGLNISQISLSSE